MQRLIILNLICGYQVNPIHKSIKYVSSRGVFIPFEGKVKSCIKRGEVFGKGQILFEVEKRKLLSSYYLPDDLGINVKDTLDYVNRIEGEYISKDDVLAEKTVSSGLLSKRVLSEHDGIVNLSTADLGYVKILSEIDTHSIVATFGGEVKDVKAGSGIFLETDVCEIPLFYTNSQEDESVFGTFKLLNDSSSISSTKNIEESFDGSIVFAGRFLYPELAMDLFKKGCKYLLVSSMNYDELKDLDIPIGILTGFGNIYFDTTMMNLFKELNNSQVVILPREKKVEFPVGLNDNISKLFEQNFYTAFLKKGDIVKSVDLDSFGLVGEIASLDYLGGSATILTQEGNTFLVPIANLQYYHEDFSLMRLRVF
jgi:hypothetical protein